MQFFLELYTHDTRHPWSLKKKKQQQQQQLDVVILRDGFWHIPPIGNV